MQTRRRVIYSRGRKKGSYWKLKNAKTQKSSSRESRTEQIGKQEDSNRDSKLKQEVLHLESLARTVQYLHLESLARTRTCTMLRTT